MSYYSTAYVSKYLGTSHSAITQWMTRDVLPEELKPVDHVNHDPDSQTRSYLWSEEQLPKLKMWYQRSNKYGRPKVGSNNSEEILVPLDSIRRLRSNEDIESKRPI